jgi:hypothetical protein
MMLAPDQEIAFKTETPVKFASVIQQWPRPLPNQNTRPG